ncbi:MAG: hypothetical protein ACKVH8_06480 [Pirellulales bacterium]
MASGHTDDVPNTFDLEANPIPESSALLHGFHSLHGVFVTYFFGVSLLNR